MIVSAGVGFALLTLACWTFGDFFIQRSARLTGIWNALFYITALGAVVLLPFAWHQILPAWRTGLALLLTLSVVMLIAALFDFEALKLGKIAIIEPVWGIELPITIGLGVTIGHDHLSFAQVIFVGLIFVGIVLAAATRVSNLKVHSRILEKGVVLAAIGATGMALGNFLTGVASQDFSPVLTIWFTDAFMALSCLVVIGLRGETKKIWTDFKRYPVPVIAESVFDNVAWVAFGAAMTHIPISVATAITETYIAFTVMLGVLVNHEKVKKHQLVGASLAIIGVIALSIIS